MDDDYQFDDLDMSATPATPPTTGGSTMGTGQSDHGYSNTHQSNQSGGGNYATELFSKQIKTKFRTFYIDLKESTNGKFFKISEKSRDGRKTTIMMDAEDVPMFIEALQEVQQHL